MEIRKFKQSIPYLLKSRITPFIWGPHGIGKSQAIKQWCDENGYEMIDLRLGTQEVGDLLGLADFVVDETTGEKIATRFMRPEWFPTDPKAKVVILCDEINRARRDVLQAVFQLVLDKRLHRYVLPADCHVMAAANPNTEDYIVADVGDEAFMDRFCHIKLAPSKSEWFDHAETVGYNKAVVNFIKQQPSLLDNAKYDFDLKVTPSRRSWEAVSKLMKMDTPLDILQELCYGLVGQAAAIAFVDSLSNSDKPIAYKDILDNYDKVGEKIKEYSNPETGGRPDLLKVSCDELRKALEKNEKGLKEKQVKNLLTFLKTIPGDISFNLTRDLYIMDHIRDHLDGDTELTEMLEKREGKKS